MDNKKCRIYAACGVSQTPIYSNKEGEEKNMLIKEDYTYINNRPLCDAGYLTLTVHSINFNRYFSAEEKEKNRIKAEHMTNSEWTESCREFSRQLAPQMKEIISVLDEKYNIHQTKPENSTMEHYRSNWDLFFWSLNGIESPELDSFNFTFNDRRTPSENMALLDDLRPLIESMEYKNIQCRIQYGSVSTPEQKDRMETEAKEILKELEKSKRFIQMWGTGRVRKVKEDGKEWYGFFRKGARNYYHPISPKDAVLWKLKQDREREAV